MMLIRNKGKLYYDKRVNRVFQVRAKASKGFLCSDYTRFLSDAQTTISTMQLSGKYIKRCKRIINYDKCPFIEADEAIGSWRVKEKYE